MKNRYLIPSLALCAGAFAASAPAAWAEGFTLKDPFKTEQKARSYTRNLTAPECPAGPQAGQELTLQQTVWHVLCRNPGARASLQSLISQATGVGTAKADYLPNISASASGSRAAIFAPETKLSTKGTSAGISLSYTLYDFGRRDSSVKAAEFALETAGQGYRQELQNLIANALQNYYRVLSSYESLRATQDAEAFAQETLNAATLRHEVGQVAISDVLQAKSAFSQSELSRQRAQNQLAISQGQLAQLMGVSPQMELQAAPIDDGMLLTDTLEMDANKAIETARTNRPDLWAQRANVEQSRENLRRARKAGLPTLSLSAGNDFSDIDVANNSTTRTQSIGLSLSIPIFTGFSETYNIRSSEHTLAAAEARLEASEIGIMQDVWNAWQNYQTAQKAWVTSLDGLESALALKDVALGRYKEGVGNILDLLSAQTQYSTALQQQAAAKYDLLITRVELVRALGTLDAQNWQQTASAQKADASRGQE